MLRRALSRQPPPSLAPIKTTPSVFLKTRQCSIYDTKSDFHISAAALDDYTIRGSAATPETELRAASKRRVAPTLTAEFRHGAHAHAHRRRRKTGAFAKEKVRRQRSADPGGSFDRAVIC